MSKFNALLLILISIFLATSAQSQITGVKYSLEYNPSGNTHDMYLIIADGQTNTAVQRTQFNAQITIVSPLNVDINIIKSYMPLNNNALYTGIEPTKWVIASQISNVTHNAIFTSITPTLSPTSQYNNLKKGDKVKLFSFATSTLLCENEVRLFENGSDPGSNDPSMMGGDFTNAFTIGSVVNRYLGNEIVKSPGCPSLHQIFVYSDANNNGSFDESDSPLPQVKMVIPSLDGTIMSNNAGLINFYSTEGGYASSVNINYGTWVNNSFDIVAQITDHSTFDTIAFVPYNPTPNGDAYLHTSFLRCNSVANVYPSVINTSSARLNVKLVATLDERVNVQSVEPTPSLIDGNEFTWVVAELAPGYIFKPIIKIEVPQAQSNTDSLTFTTKIIDKSSATLHSFEYNEVIKCSYDPNDKRVWPNRKGEENLTLNNEKLRYTIRFQNNGNDTAFAVKIVDVLDKNLDQRTLSVKDASHEVRPVIKGDTIFFIFDPIVLPDSTTNYLASQGYVTYEIKLAVGVPNETQIKNTAEIIFDRNPPIITNTTLNTILDKFPCPADAIWEDNFVLLVNQSSNTYSWYNCDDNELVSKTNEPSFRPTKSGSYYCVIDGDYCVTKTNCIAFIVSGTDDNQNEQVNLYPNPSNGLVYVAAGKSIDFIELYDISGHKVFGAQYLDGQTKKTLTLDHLTPNQYVIKVISGKDIMINKITIIK